MISVTPDAAAKLLKMISKENEGVEIPAAAGLRVYLVAAGRSGTKYGLRLEKEPKQSDEVFEFHGLRIFVDQQYAVILNGAEISREQNLLLGINQFKITLKTP